MRFLRLINKMIKLTIKKICHVDNLWAVYDKEFIVYEVFKSHKAAVNFKNKVKK
jgi:hypothetical protein